MTASSPCAAQSSAPTAAVALERVARQGVLSALPTAQQPTSPPAGDNRYPVAWLTITAPGRGATPTATSVCACGRDRFAAGHRKVLALIEDHTTHRTLCPLLNRTTEGRAAA
ncbi:hypothetical protein [Streptomyces smyrnaeus]|uniref:hypothetical protein n=1 Tax=Streptomyces smyrnaeus TaxID=1387713 RepID=UPI0033E4D2DB